MKNKTIIRNLESAISPYDEYCDGYGNLGASGNSYIIGFVLGVGQAGLSLKHDGSQVLSEINAFDRAEVYGTYLGQINMSIVSSFCGPQGLIWGYDIARVQNLRTKHKLGLKTLKYRGRKIPVYSAAPLLTATRKLFGTVDKKHFPLMAGAHVPCAGKSFKDVGPRHIYAAFAIGIAEYREKDANLLMEDLGWLPLKQDKSALVNYKKLVLNNLAESILSVGINQKVKYKEIFLEIIDIEVPEGFIGCSLVAIPYFTLAKKAIPKEGLDSMIKMNLTEWETK
jgi:histidine decarboxylase